MSTITPDINRNIYPKQCDEKDYKFYNWNTETKHIEKNDIILASSGK